MARDEEPIARRVFVARESVEIAARFESAHRAIGRGLAHVERAGERRDLERSEFLNIEILNGPRVDLDRERAAEGAVVCRLAKGGEVAVEVHGAMIARRAVCGKRD